MHLKQNLEEIAARFAELEERARGLPNREFADIVRTAHRHIVRLTTHPDVDALHEISEGRTPEPPKQEAGESDWAYNERIVAAGYEPVPPKPFAVSTAPHPDASAREPFPGGPQPGPFPVQDAAAAEQREKEAERAYD